MEEKRILLDRLEINYKISGSGFPILILHGWRGSSDSWKNVIERLSVSFLVIAPDLPGFGKSQDPPDPFDLEDYVSFVSDFLEFLKIEKVFLLGHSFGGAISLLFSHFFPKKVEKLILISPAIVREGKMSLRQRLASLLAKIGKRMLKSNSFFLKKIVYKIANNYDYFSMNDVMKETFKNIIKRDLSCFLPLIENETLLLWGEKDKILKVKYAFKIKEKLKNAKLEILPQNGHSPHLERPEILTEKILSFLKK